MGDLVRVLVVDDSPFIRHVVSKALDDDPAISVAGQAGNGLDALEKIRALEPDVVSLDIEMPRLDGLETLKRIMAECPTPVVMLSALTQRGARATIQSLMLGAVDFVPKPAAAVGIHSIMDELIAKIKVAAGTAPAGAPVVPAAASKSSLGPQPYRKGTPLIVIGASTGGPRALQLILRQLPADLPAALAIVQHMPPRFTRALAKRMNDNCAFTVQEAADGDRLASGLALLAPGDFHLRLQGRSQVALDQGPRRNHLRPAVDVSLESAAALHGSAVIGVVLTGMGTDGTEGARHVKAAGGRVLAEHESSSVVYGMPRSVIEAGLADRIVPLSEIASTLIEWVG